MTTSAERSLSSGGRTGAGIVDASDHNDAGCPCPQSGAPRSAGASRLRNRDVGAAAYRHTTLPTCERSGAGSPPRRRGSNLRAFATRNGRAVCARRGTRRGTSGWTSDEQRRHPARRGPQGVRRLRGRRTRQLLDRPGRVLRHARAVRLRQDDDAEDDRRLRATHLRPGAAQRRGREPGPALQAQRQHGLPAVRAVPAHERLRQRALRTAQPRSCRRTTTRRASPRCSTSCG